MNKFQSIIDALADVVFVHHPVTGKIEFINETCFQLYGYTAKELASKGLKLIVADEKFDFKKQLQLIEKAAKGEVLTFEWKTKKASGDKFWVEVTLKKAEFDNDIKVVATVRDITPRKEAIKAFEERELLLVSINKNISEGLYRSFSKGGLIYANAALANMFGYDTVEEILSVNSSDLYANPEDRIGLSPTVLDDGYRTDVETLYKRKDGSTFWGMNSCLLSKDHQGNGVFDGAVRDITKERDSNRRIEESQRILHSINQNISEGIYRSYSKGGLIYANDAFAKMFGYDSVEDILSIKSLDLYAEPKDRKGLTPTVLEVGFRSDIDTHFKRKDGSTFWGVNSFVLTKDHQGNDVFDGAVRDVTEEREIQLKIEESQRILTSINHNISEGVYRSYSKGGLIYANDAFAKMFGYDSVEEILRVKSLDLYAKATGRKGLTDKVIEHGSRSNLATCFKRKDGSTFWGLNSAILTKDHEGNEIFDGAVRDITNEKKAAEELKALNDELLERNFELDQLVYKTSHDLRSPLRSVLGLTNLMKVENPAQIEYFDRIEERILKMDEFIKSMLNYSRANRLDLKNEDVHFPDIIAACVTDLEYLDGFKEFNIIESYDGNFSEIKVDKLRLSIVFSNIISNAFKYRKTNSDESYLKISISYKNDLLLIQFEDNGIGIDKKYLERVFEMFFRATEKSEGSGLGMYIVKQAIEKLNGKVSVTSALNIGTKIRVEIPS